MVTNSHYFYLGVHMDPRGIFLQLVLEGEVLMVLHHPDYCRTGQHVIYLVVCTHIRS